MKKILITGASAGIGQATAILLAEKGYTVLMAARRQDRLQKIIEAHPILKGRLLAGELDVTDAASVAAFVGKNTSFLTDLDALVNNAGLALGRDSFQAGSFADAERMLATNVTGLLRLTHAVLPFMVARKNGHVLNLGSVAGRTAYKGGTVYCATKAAVHMITDALRIDLGGTGVRVTTVGAGRVDTDFSLVRFKGDAAKARAVYDGLRPLSAQDMAEAIVWALERPVHVNIQYLEVMPTDQPSATDLAPLK